MLDALMRDRIDRLRRRRRFRAHLGRDPHAGIRRDTRCRFHEYETREDHRRRLRPAGRGGGAPIRSPVPQIPACHRRFARPNSVPMGAAAYLPFLIQACWRQPSPARSSAASHLFGQRRGIPASRIRPTSAASRPKGSSTRGSRSSSTSTALLFMLFDLEIVILVPWTFIYREFLANHIAILGPILFFIGVLVLGLSTKSAKAPWSGSGEDGGTRSEQRPLTPHAARENHRPEPDHRPAQPRSRGRAAGAARGLRRSSFRI